MNTQDAQGQSGGTPPVALKAGATYSQYLNFLSEKWKGSLLLITVIAVFILAVNLLVTPLKDTPRELYTLVPDKISKSAPITIMLPEEVDLTDFDPARSVNFTPAIEGAWQPEPERTRIYKFLPSQQLNVGSYFLATLDTPTLQIEKMFSIDEDPKVIAILPKTEVEVSETSNITIIFNRPMVPLTTIDNEPTSNLPIAITPETKGKFKWITSRTLQFIPEERLKRASNYLVEVKSGLTSQDGLRIEPFTHAFNTRALSIATNFYGESIATALSHSQPIRFYFNQPVDLSQTKNEITLVNANGASVPFTLSHGVREEYNYQTQKKESFTDRSIVELFPAKDIHGRKYLWDFGSSYTLTLNKAHPEEGTLVTMNPITRQFTIRNPIESVEATSPRSAQVMPSLFDPKGTLVFNTSEPIDISASSISGKGVTTVTYGERCVGTNDPTQGYQDPSTCTKEADKQKIVVAFDGSAFSLGESSSVVLNKLVNTEGVQLNTDPITQPLTTFGALHIISTNPTNGSKDADLKMLRLCTNNPLVTPDEKDFPGTLKSNMMIGYWNWDQSFYINEKIPNQIEQCPVGTFETHIRYGLVPNFNYNMTLTLDDHFGQQIVEQRSFTTSDGTPLDKNISHLQPQILMSPSDRTMLTYAADFMSFVNVNICKVTPETMLRYRSFPLNANTPPSGITCTETKQSKVELPEGYATRKYLRINISDYFANKVGNYVVTLSHPDYRKVSREWDPQTKKEVLIKGELLYERTYLTVTDLAVAGKLIGRNSHNSWDTPENNAANAKFMKNKWPNDLYWVSNARSLDPISGAIITPYRESESTLIKLTDTFTQADGVAETASGDNVVGAIVRKGDDSAIISNYSDTIGYAQNASAAKRQYIYTDRPIYRPGDTVHIKGISRIGYDANFEPVTGTTTLEIRDARYEIARTVPVGGSMNGTFETSIILDTKAPLGYYQINTQDGGYGSFQVEEYVAPQFKAEISADKEEYTSGDTALFNIDANYYFGVPVSSGNVDYRIVAQDYYFDRYRDEYFSFGGGWYWEYNSWYGDQYLSSGSIPLEQNGRATLSQALNIDTLFKGNYTKQSKLITLYATVKNENGQSVSTQRSFILHRGSYYLGLVTKEYFNVSGKEGLVKWKSVDQKGKPIKVSDLTLKLDKVEWKSYKRQEVDGNFYYRSERVLEPVSTQNVSSDANGNGEIVFTPTTAGEYQFTLTGEDDSGNSIATSYTFYVSGSEMVNIRPTNNESLELISEKTDVKVGEKAGFIIKSPYQKAKALITIARGDTYERKIIDITGSLTRFDFTVNERHIPNVSAGVLLLSPDPEIKYGEIWYNVDTKEKELDITITPSKRSYLPGEEVTLDVTVKDSRGTPTQTELSLSVVNMSVLALVGNPKKDLARFFYGGEPLTIRTLTNVKNVLNVADIPVGTKGGSGDGGSDLEKKKRGLFKDTAYWNGQVETDANGRATVKFTLPDDLTTWQVEGVGITKDTKVGQSYTDFKTQKSVMATPLKPRFILPGDTFSVGGTVFNETESTQKLTVTVDSPTLTLTGKHKLDITLEPHSSISVSFPAVAPNNITDGAHQFTLKASNKQFEDEVSSKFPIAKNDTYEYNITAGKTSDPSLVERLYLPNDIVPDRGALDISVNATLAALADRAALSLVIYPYECSEQVASKLRAIAITKQNADLFGRADQVLPKSFVIGGVEYDLDTIIAMGLAKLYQNQNADGGVSFYPNAYPNYWVTLATLNTYIDLKKAGYKVDPGKLESAANYVFNRITFTRQDAPISEEDFILGAYSLSRLDSSRWYTSAMNEKIRAYAKDEELIHKRLSSTALANLGVLSVTKGFAANISNRLFAEFENRSTIDARGTVVNGNIDAPSMFVEDTIANTALALKAHALTKRDSPLLEGYLRAIKQTKNGENIWGGTYTTIAVIDAVSEYLKWKKEQNANFTLTVSLGDTQLINADVNKNTVLDTFATSVPVANIAKGVSQNITFTKKDRALTKDAYYYDIGIKYYLPAAKIASRDEGFAVTRALYKLDDTQFKNPVNTAIQGEVLRGRIVISTPKIRRQVAIEDFIPAGLEVVNQRLATEDSTLGMNSEGFKQDTETATKPQPQSNIGIASYGPRKGTDGELSDRAYSGLNTSITTLYPSAVEAHDDRVFAFIESLAQGEYVYEYYVRALVPGTYQYLPAVVSELYSPENFGRTRGDTFTVTEKSR